MEHQAAATEDQHGKSDGQTRSARGIFERPIGISGFANTGLRARDLSAGGLRVAPHPALSIGARLTLKIPCADGAPAIEVDAEVTRDDGQRGAIFQFNWFDTMERERLSSFVRRLNPVSPAPASAQESTPAGDDDEAPTLAIVR